MLDGDTGSSQTYMPSTKSGNANSSIDPATHLGIGCLPTIGDFTCQSFIKLLSFCCQHPVHRQNIRSEISAAVQARLQVFLLLLQFLLAQNICRSRRQIRVAVCITNTHIDDATCLFGPDTSHQQVSKKSFRSILIGDCWGSICICISSSCCCVTLIY